LSRSTAGLLRFENFYAPGLDLTTVAITILVKEARGKVISDGNMDIKESDLRVRSASADEERKRSQRAALHAVDAETVAARRNGESIHCRYGGRSRVLRLRHNLTTPLPPAVLADAGSVHEGKERRSIERQ